MCIRYGYLNLLSDNIITVFNCFCRTIHKDRSVNSRINGIKDNITYGLSRLGYSKPEIEEKLMAIAEKMKISDQLNKYPAACSGGQNQRASIARALIRNPRILLLDEPLSSLDLNLKEELLLEIRRLCTEEKMTMIYVTHDRHEAEQAGDRIALMNEGRLLCVSPAKELYDSRQPSRSQSFWAMNIR